VGVPCSAKRKSDGDTPNRAPRSALTATGRSAKTEAEKEGPRMGFIRAVGVVIRKAEYGAGRVNHAEETSAWNQLSACE
jgi:hypothetical protein